MADIQITREFQVSPERLFRAVTEQAEILNWWGHDGMTIPARTLDFTRLGPWFSEMIGKDGTRYKLSGQVTHVTPPSSVGFTWGWHDAEDQRGAESHVTFTVEATEQGARLIVDHRELPGDDVAGRHETGWTSGPLPRLERYLAG
ncbi:SRPBCC domain-containing protein [uncultured Roseovarius sp.]|uniref:SRPBCC family protein n=1 Tax=uncultured Roseovarius sp. TaxID=293344 RepID=UPI00262DB01A|nr:SRPBCC domain-containing protein [uncultured Roseovarius sp.]